MYSGEVPPDPFVGRWSGADPVLWLVSGEAILDVPLDLRLSWSHTEATTGLREQWISGVNGGYRDLSGAMALLRWHSWRQPKLLEQREKNTKMRESIER